MSAFAVKVVSIKAIEPIENADAIELAVVSDYRSVVRKNQFKAGDLVIYIPEAAIVPQEVLQKLGLDGKLAGPEKNRVKAIKLRGYLSQGIVVSLDILTEFGLGDRPDIYTPREGDDVSKLLGIMKYEPPIPIHMAGEIYNAEIGIKFDIENIKSWPDVFIEGEEVSITEKIHGTFCSVCLLPANWANEKHVLNRFVVASKGLAARGVGFKDNDANKNNVYLRALKNGDIFNKIFNYYDTWNFPIFFLGEVYGPVQDLHYGNDLAFRVFDICTGIIDELYYMPPIAVAEICHSMGINMVPILYTGPYEKEIVTQLTSGKETVSGKESHIREGVVIRPIVERKHNNLGRVILKSVSPEYLLRKGNVTEYN